MKATIHNANIRGHEVKTNKNNEPYIIVRYEDESGKPERVIDKNMSHQDSYSRDTMMDIDIDINEGRQYTNIRVADIKILDGKSKK